MPGSDQVSWSTEVRIGRRHGAAVSSSTGAAVIPFSRAKYSPGLARREHRAERGEADPDLAALIRIDGVRGAVDDHHRHRLVGRRAGEVFRRRPARRDRRDARELPGLLQREAIGELAAVRPAGGEDALPVDLVVGGLLLDHRVDEALVVDVHAARGLRRSLAAIVPGRLEAVGIDDDKAVGVGEHVEFLAGDLAHPLAVAARAVEDEQQRRVRLQVARHVLDIGAIHALHRELMAHDRARRRRARADRRSGAGERYHRKHNAPDVHDATPPCCSFKLQLTRSRADFAKAISWDEEPDRTGTCCQSSRFSFEGGRSARALFFRFDHCCVTGWASLLRPLFVRSRGSDTPAFSQPADEQPYVYGSSVSDLLRNKLIGSSVQAGSETLQAEPLRRVYGARNYEPIWTGSEAADANARLVLDALSQADAEGLRAGDYRKAN